MIRQSRLGPHEAEAMADVYYHQQKHDSLPHYLNHQLVEKDQDQSIFVQVSYDFLTFIDCCVYHEILFVMAKRPIIVPC